MATSTAQRVGIWVIAVVMVIGTLAGFAAAIFAQDDQQTDSTQQQEEYEKALADYQKQMDEQKKLYEPLSNYKATSFNPSTVTKLKVETLDKGSGKTAAKDSTVSAEYFGWDANGDIFDTTKLKGKESESREFSLSGVIEGWTKGLTGVKEGSTVRLTIPAAEAYGDEDTGGGQPTGPLKFVIKLNKVSEPSDE